MIKKILNKDILMKEKHMNLFFPQWQGAGRSKELLKGALEIKEKYISAHDFFEIAVSEEENCETENNILGYEVILQQLKSAKSVLTVEKPDNIFTVGGGCDVEIPVISYLNDMLKGDLTVIWVDAHGDLNTPESSPSKNFHGMPLRTLLGDGNQQMIESAFSKLYPYQLVMVGQRDLDEPEKAYIDEHKITVLSVEEVHSNMDCVVDVIRAKGSRNIYIHIDLDVLDYEEFPYVMVPSPDGLKSQTLFDLMVRLKDSFAIAGLSLLEYTSSEEKEAKILLDIIQMGVAL